MKNPTPTLIAAALSLALCAPLALAQDWSVSSQEGQATDTKLTWAELDADGDGMLSAEEAAGIAALGDAFDEADADDDGLLTAEEYRDWYQAQPQAQGGAGVEAEVEAEAEAEADVEAEAGQGIRTDDGGTTDDGSSDRDPGADGGTLR